MTLISWIKSILWRRDCQSEGCELGLTGMAIEHEDDSDVRLVKTYQCIHCDKPEVKEEYFV